MKSYNKWTLLLVVLRNVCCIWWHFNWCSTPTFSSLQKRPVTHGQELQSVFVEGGQNPGWLCVLRHIIEGAIESHPTCIIFSWCQRIIIFWWEITFWFLILTFLLKSIRNLFSMMTRCISNYSKDDIYFPANNKCSRRRTIKHPVVASVSVTV